MDDLKPTTPPADQPLGDDPAHDRTAATVPDPHALEPAPTPQEGTRPGVDPAIRPEQDEPGGPLAGLVGTTTTQVTDEATPGDDPAAEALLAQMGVEEEGIESGQLLGFVAATLAVVAVLAVVVIYLIYTPFRDDVRVAADDVDLYPDLKQSRVDAIAKLDRATRSGEAYTVPITRAMGLVAAQYGSQATGEAYADEAVGLPTTRAAWNTLMVNRTMGRTVQAVPAAPGMLSQPAPAVAAPAGADPSSDVTLRPQTDVEVGVDDLSDGPESPPDN